MLSENWCQIVNASFGSGWEVFLGMMANVTLADVRFTITNTFTELGSNYQTEILPNKSLR